MRVISNQSFFFSFARDLAPNVNAFVIVAKLTGLDNCKERHCVY